MKNIRVCLAVFAAVAMSFSLTGCGGGGGHHSSSSSNSATILGVTTPTNVSVVTAQNSNAGG